VKAPSGHVTEIQKRQRKSETIHRSAKRADKHTARKNVTALREKTVHESTGYADRTTVKDRPKKQRKRQRLKEWKKEIASTKMDGAKSRARERWSGQKRKSSKERGKSANKLIRPVENPLRSRAG